MSKKIVALIIMGIVAVSISAAALMYTHEDHAAGKFLDKPCATVPTWSNWPGECYG